MTAADDVFALGENVAIPMAREPRTPLVDVTPSRLPAMRSSIMINMNSILGAASNPVSPGPSSPPLEQPKDADIVPPTRPSSTPFPHPERRNSVRVQTHSDDGRDEFAADLSSPTLGYYLDGCDEDGDMSMTEPPAPPQMNFNDLPAEIHECILDHLFGYRVSATSKSSVDMHCVTRSWGTALRHSRRKELAELALVSKVWRDLIQGRLYRHIKLRATLQSLDQAMDYFSEHRHLQPYVKHVEIWFPVFQPKYGPLALTNTLTLPTVTVDGLTNATYILPSDNSTLEEAMCFVADALPEATILTLEGGERKKAPKVAHFFKHGEMTAPQKLPVLPSIQSLVTKGQWNLMRDDDDFHNILSALPNLTEWHGSYSKPKSKSYLSMSSILPQLPTLAHLTSLNLCLEGDYRREVAVPPFFMKVNEKVHFCTKLGESIPTLEHLSYTGRVCKDFSNTAGLLTNPRSTRLRSVDLTVKNICRPVDTFEGTASGIQDMGFIRSFEALVLAGIRSLAKLKAAQFLRVRFVDLDSICPPLNPYFLLKDGYCSGIWSDEILAALNKSRPQAQWLELRESFGDICFGKDGRWIINPEYPRARVLSLKTSNYGILATGISIQ